MKKPLSLLTSGCLFVVTLFTGCGFLDALDTFHYVGIYEDSYKKEGLSEKDRAGKFDEFLAAITATTGYAAEVIERDANYRMARLVIPKEKNSGLNRVILYDSYLGNLGVSIIKVPPGEDAEVIELKKNIEKALEAVRLRQWTFYIQRTHGQIFNS